MSAKTVKIVLFIWIALGMVVPAHAAVPVEQARRLEKDLTSFGAQRAGNADGSIPEISKSILFHGLMLQMDVWSKETILFGTKGKIRADTMELLGIFELHVYR